MFWKKNQRGNIVTMIPGDTTKQVTESGIQEILVILATHGRQTQNYRIARISTGNKKPTSIGIVRPSKPKELSNTVKYLRRQAAAE